MRHEESKLQRACVEWFRRQYPRKTLFAIPNGGARSKVEAAIMKGEGVLAGVADLFVMAAGRDAQGKDVHGLFIEMKVGKNGQTDAQLTFGHTALGAGYGYVVARDLEGFMEVVNNYLGE